MAGFGRSNSLSINTGGGGGAGGGSLFGGATNASSGQQSARFFGTSNTSQPQSSSLFGSTSQPQQSGSLFGGGATSQPQSGGLFGQQTSQPQSGGMFGQAQPQAQPAQTGGLFGNLQKPAGQQTGSLFGSSTAQSQPQQSGGPFGGTLGQQNQNQPQSGGLFSNLNQQQKPATPSLFGSQPAQQQQQQQQTSAPSLFGSSTQQNTQQQPQQSSLFGSMSQNQPKPFGGGISLGGHSVTGPSPSATGGAVQLQDMSAIKGTTRFSDLHPDIQEQIEKIDKIILGEIEKSDNNRGMIPRQGERVKSLSPDVTYVENLLSTVELGIDNDSVTIEALKDITKKDAEDALLSFRAVENLKLPPAWQYGNTSSLGASRNPGSSSSDPTGDDDISKPVDLIAYFSKRADELGETLGSYVRQINEIETHLGTMDYTANLKYRELTSGGRGSDAKRELVGTLKEFEGAVLNLATHVGKTRDMVVAETIGAVGR